jgi:hypothetical protein
MGIFKIEKYMEKALTPPKGNVIASIKPEDWSWQTEPPSWKGLFAVGKYLAENSSAAAIAFPSKTQSKPGDYAEIKTTVPVPQFKGKLKLAAYINDTLVTDKWTKYRFMQVWVNSKKVWEEDIALSREGREWVSIDITEAVKGSKELILHFRVEDKKKVGNYTTVSFLGPVYLYSE